MNAFIATTFGADNVNSSWKAIDATLKGAHDHLELVFISDSQRLRLYVTEKSEVEPGLYEIDARAFQKNAWRFYRLDLQDERVTKLCEAASQPPGKYDWIAACQTVGPRFLRDWPWRLVFGRETLQDATYCARAAARALKVVGLCVDLDDWPTSNDVIYSLRSSGVLHLVSGLPTSSERLPLSA